MNKIAQASIATAAGVALLLGGAGTFANWNDTTTAAGSTISAGNLVVTDGPVGTWTANGSPISIDAYAMAPGDVLTFTKTMQVQAEGDSLEAELALAGGSIAASDAGNSADQTLAGRLTASVVLSAVGDGIEANGDSFTITPGTGTVAGDVTVTATITFPNGTTATDNGAMNGSVDLSAMTVSLTQATS